jgi:hypothetical protein
VGEIHLGDMSRSVKDYLAGINEYIFLPGLQREFVWAPSQMAELFDSLIRGYPVGILTEWNVRSSNVGNFNSYRFLNDYIATKGHPPEEVLDADFSRYNDPIEEDMMPEVLIIDGQQRLNSMYIGVCGQIAEYNGGSGYPRDDVSNWEQKELCIDLFGHPDFDGDDVRGDYEFRFRRVDGFGKNVKTGYEQVQGKHYLWMPVGDLWDSENDGLVDQGVMRDIVESYVKQAEIPTDESTRLQLRDIATTVARDLRGEVLTTELKNDLVDQETSAVPEIFQRLNMEGEDPKPYQLFMSRLMSYWPYADDEDLQINPREQVEKWIDDFCHDYPEYERYIDRNLFMRYSSYLIKRSLLVRDIKRLSDDGMDNLRMKWLEGSPSATHGRFEWFRNSLAKVFEIIISAGIRKKVMHNMPTFAVLGQFFYYNPDAEVNDENRNAIFRFIAQCLLLNESYSVFTIGNARSWMRYLHDRQGEYDVFPGDELLSHENLNPSREDIRLVIKNANYTGGPGQRVFTNRNVAAILGLLDEVYTSHAIYDIKHYDVDHIFPLAKEETVETAVGHEVDLNRIGNLQLLYHSLNREEKREMWPEDWFETIEDAEEAEIRRVNQYPNMTLKPDMVEEFITSREERLIDHLEEKYVK